MAQWKFVFDPTTGKARLCLNPNEYQMVRNTTDVTLGDRFTVPQDKLQIDPVSGELTVPSTGLSDDFAKSMSASVVICGRNITASPWHQLQFDPVTRQIAVKEFEYNRAGNFYTPLEKDKIVIVPRSRDKKEVSVKTMHISCKSDTYEPGHNYGGVIIYQYNDKSEWRTANNTHCKSGYIVIQDTDSTAVKKWKNEPGVVHGAVYRNAFGESVNNYNAEVVGEGFAIRNRKSVETFEINSSVFNNPPKSEFHDHRRRMHELSEHCVRKIVEYWKTAGPRWVRERNFEIKQLLEDFDLDGLARLPRHDLFEVYTNSEKI